MNSIVCWMLSAVIFGNFFGQFLCPEPDWSVAIERSFWQAYLALVILIAYYVEGSKTKEDGEK